MDGSEWRKALAVCSPDELTDVVCQVAALESAARAALLEAVLTFDRHRLWVDDGAASMEAWLCARLGTSYHTASELLRVARALERLPNIAQAFSEGRLSWDQVRALSRFATPETDQTLADEAPGWSVWWLQRLARRAEPVTAQETEEAHRRRSLRFWWERDRMLRLEGRLPAAEGAVVRKALERIAESAPPDPDTGGFEPYEARCADALVQLASQQLAHDTDPDRATVVVHIDSDVLTGAGAAVAELEDGPPLSGETAQRLACDARWQIMPEHDGIPVGIGRTSRRIPPWLNRQLRLRDQGCRFPGCGRRRWAHGHHIIFWGSGGRTDLDNLALLCGHHHRLVHEGHWSISGNPDGDLTFHRPDGTPYRPKPPTFQPWVRPKLLDPLLPRNGVPIRGSALADTS
jgi:hypothetical protein